MSLSFYHIDLGQPALLEFRGPDAVRFLNGQTTQDVRRLVGGEISLHSCVTDAKGRLQFRVSLTSVAADVVWVSGLAEWREALETRLTRYLIADDVEVLDHTGAFRLIHFTGQVEQVPEGVISRSANRYGIAGMDWWIPLGLEIDLAKIAPLLDFQGLETLRITHGIPAWGRELTEGMLPPEAGLEETDISYQKGCYIGQEVISRIKSAGKLNRYLSKFLVSADAPMEVGVLFDSSARASGEITSVSPQAQGDTRLALGYAKRGASEFFLRDESGNLSAVKRV